MFRRHYNWNAGSAEQDASSQAPRPVYIFLWPRTASCIGFTTESAHLFERFLIDFGVILQDSGPFWPAGLVSVPGCLPEILSSSLPPEPKGEFHQIEQQGSGRRHGFSITGSQAQVIPSCAHAKCFVASPGVLFGRGDRSRWRYICVLDVWEELATSLHSGLPTGNGIPTGILGQTHKGQEKR